MATRLLVCTPGHYGVRYAINPWMSRHVGDTTPDAVRQWERFVELLGCVGETELIQVEPTAQTPDLVFTSNAALMCGNLAIVSSFRNAERRREQPVFRAALARAGYATTFLRQTYFEGAGDALFDRVRPILYAGYGWRTERGATLQLQEIVSCRVLPLLLVDERFFHLDLALCPLSSGHVMAYMDAFSPHAQQLLRRAIEPGYLIEVSVDDALRLACNAVEIGDAVVMHDCSTRLRERLHAAGYRVFRTDLSEFLKSGGSAKCLTLRLDDGPALGIAAATA
ncbi:MAG TPA: arginine deiminase-related protein [Candidatus Limnocylindria bacterium]|jgi:N-dimethylarginine dimethylaminohydrolase|nr:arginine deiminase-related protein [Candidatus Limnocylindria bacterium]